ncbi:MAG: hypothetical protein AB1349_07890 [Elusimicrobiota bacterium]
MKWIKLYNTETDGYRWLNLDMCRTIDFGTPDCDGIYEMWVNYNDESKKVENTFEITRKEKERIEEILVEQVKVFL